MKCHGKIILINNRMCHYLNHSNMSSAFYSSPVVFFPSIFPFFEIVLGLGFSFGYFVVGKLEIGYANVMLLQLSSAANILDV